MHEEETLKKQSTLQQMSIIHTLILFQILQSTKTSTTEHKILSQFKKHILHSYYQKHSKHHIQFQNK